ncbi:hypothetical protein BJ878DRAFT_160102 [Calycina marina]|uniref:RNA polymerase II degradation factor 1 n=1 Tax=Calycina marina TaxID=1763456 RepID=A0A9P7YZ38_9HELO|nr:hypothetical protein BJ878DRAFT_160102 [Calycina marina]
MSEVPSRPAAPRGRGSARGGRGGFSSRGGRGGRSNAINGDKPEPVVTEDDNQVTQLKKKYGSKVSTIKEMFPDWTDEDVVFALQETDGDLTTTVERISDGSITQWGEVSKVKKTKTKDAIVSTFGDASNTSKFSRGGRGGAEAGRGGRGRGAERSRGGRGRGASVANTNGAHKENDGPGTESAAWDTTIPAATTAVEPGAWDTKQPSSDEACWDKPTTQEQSNVTKVATSIIPEGVKKSWASMFAPAPIPKKAPAPAEKPIEALKNEKPVESPAAEPETPAEPSPVEPALETPVETAAVDEPEQDLTPSKDDLTETNLERVLDTSNPAPVATAASTAASSWDPRIASAAGAPYTGLPPSQPQAIRPPPASGFQASALKATGSSGRTPSYQRRVLDQEEAVRMPGNREVDRAAVQFGAFNLNGSGDEDVDGDREEPETRAQPPQHSPVAQPRAALPPAPQQAAPVPESLPTPKQPTGLPAAAPVAAPGLPSPQTLPSTQNSQQAPLSRYGYEHPASQEASLPSKPFNQFGGRGASTQSPFEGYPNAQAHSQGQPQSGPFSSAPPNDYSSYYNDSQQRAAYNSYYQQQYGVPPPQPQQEGSGPQRSYSGYGGPQAEGAASQQPQTSAQQAQSRFPSGGEGQASGHTTPNPTAQGQTPGAGQGTQSQPGHPQQQQAGGYPYGHPYYSSPYYAQFMNQYQGYGGGNYGAAPYGAKGGVHGQQAYPYGGPGGHYNQHSATPAAGGFGGSSVPGRDTALGGSFGDYGRAGSVQSSQAPQGLGGSAFGGSHDAFGRGSSYQGQNQQQYGANQGAQPSAGDDLKPFGESKTANGPSPSLSQAGRPGSATNTVPGSGLPQPQSQQSGYGGYPSHLQQGHGLHGNQAGAQYGAASGASAHQSAGQGHQSSQYDGYQPFAGAGGNYYGGNQQQQQQQQRGGWGGNYGH